MFSDNLKFLRKHHGYTQQDLSELLTIPRTTLGDYERSHTEPNLAMLLKLSKIFDVTVDQLVSKKLSPANVDIAKTNDLKILAISVNDDNESNIELVDTKAAAGYLDQFTDPEFIKELPKFVIPKMPTGTYRGFEIKGDSMLPLEEGSVVICSYIERLTDIKNDKTYVVISQENGVVYKRVQNLPKEKAVLLTSDNENFKPYKLPYNEIQELWQYYAHLSFSDHYYTFNSIVDEKLSNIHAKVNEIHSKLIN